MKLILERWQAYLDEQEKQPRKTPKDIFKSNSKSNQGREYIVYFPPNIDRSKPVNAVLYFHGRGYSKSYFNKLKSKISTDNYVFIFPFLSNVPDAGRVKLDPSFINDVEKNLGIKINKLKLYGHSGGGRPMSLFAANFPEDRIEKIVHLDTSYGYGFTKRFLAKSSPAMLKRISFYYIPGTRTEVHAKRHNKKHGVKIFPHKGIHHQHLAWELYGIE